MEDNTIKDLVSDMLSNIVLGDKPEEEQVTSTGLMSSLPGIRTPTQVQQQDEQEAAPKARDKVKEFILRLSDEAEDTNNLRYSEKAAPEITDVMVDSETLLNRYATPLYVYARNLRDYNPERSTIKVRNRGDHSERFLDQMYELARQSSEEAALARMEMGITESLPRSAPRMGFDVQGLIDAVNRENALRAGTKPLPSIPEVETEELDDEEVAILSDTDIDTDDADGGAAPSDGKGLMAKPYDELRMREENEPLGIRNTVISALDKDITKNGTFSNTALENAIKETTNNSTFNASVLGNINKETGGSGPIDEKGYGNLTGAQAAKDKRTRGGNDPESVARRAAYEALDKNPEFINGDRETKDKMIFDIFYDDQYRKAGLKLGNTQAGDGSLFKGRGLIQITGRENYKKVQDKLAEKGIQVDLMASPELVNDNKYALPVALAFLEVKGITPDTIDELGPYKMTRIMNPGDVSGAKDRWSEVTDLLTGDALEKAQNSDEKTAQLKVGVETDGIIGNKSVAAFKKWLSDAGINFDSSYTPYDLVRLVNAN